MAGLNSIQAHLLNAPCANAAAVTPNDSADLAIAATALYIGGAGNVVVDMVGGQTSVTFTGVAAGTTLSIQVARVRATNTTATAIVALW